MKSYEVTKIGQHRGKPRLWLEGSKALLGGFLPGKRFEAKKNLDKQMLTLELSDSGCRIVSRKLKGERERPFISFRRILIGSEKWKTDQAQRIADEVAGVLASKPVIKVVLPSSCIYRSILAKEYPAIQ